MTMFDEGTLLVLSSTPEALVKFCLLSPAVEGSERAALAGAWHWDSITALQWDTSSCGPVLW